MEMIRCPITCLTQLPDEILIRILGLVPAYERLVIIPQVCHKLKDLSKRQQLWQEFCLETKYEKLFEVQINPESGNQTLRIAEWNEHQVAAILNFVAQNCVQVTALYMHFCMVPILELQHFSLACPHLSSVRLTDCKKVTKANKRCSNVHDGVAFPGLQFLEISTYHRMGSDHKTVDLLSRVSNSVTSLELRGVEISMPSLVELRNCVRLQHLVLDASISSRASQNNTRLTKLLCKLFTWREMRSIRVLELTGLLSVNAAVLNSVSRIPRLESLTVARCGSLHDWGVESVIIDCWKLRRLSIIACDDFTGSCFDNLRSRNLKEVQLLACPCVTEVPVIKLIAGGVNVLTDIRM